MPATVLTSDHYDAVRALIAPDITDTHISDAYLSQLPFAPEAEKEVRRKLNIHDINVDDLTGDSLDDARLAMMHECAAVLCLTAPQLIQNAQLDVQSRVQEIDWQEKRTFHLSESDQKVNAILITETEEEDATRSRLNPFTAVGTERRESQPSSISRRIYPFSTN